MLDNTSAEQISELLETISKPTRLSILSAIGQEEACVCHLEAVLGLQQSYISQHLMALRSAGQLDTRREGRYVYYSLCDERILAWIEGVAALMGIYPEELKSENLPLSQTQCSCPKCKAEAFIDVLDVG